MVRIPKANTVNLFDGRQSLPCHHQPRYRLRPWPHKLTHLLDLFLPLRRPWQEMYLLPALLLESRTAKQLGVDSRVLPLTAGVDCAASTASLMEVVVPRRIHLP